MADSRAQAVAILPARGGSKRIPRKNIRAFAGKPAIAWPIAAARKSGLFDRIVVSTDDAEIARISEQWGGEAPFRRSAPLADDHTGTAEVVADAVRRLEVADDAAVCCLYPTALFATAADIVEGMRLLQAGARWVLTLGRYRTPVQRAYRIDRATGLARPMQPGMMPRRSQDLEPAFYDAGQSYWGRAASWRDPDSRIWDGAAAVILPPHRAVDIDTIEDWRRAEELFALAGRMQDAPSVSG